MEGESKPEGGVVGAGVSVWETDHPKPRAAWKIPLALGWVLCGGTRLDVESMVSGCGRPEFDS